MAAFSQVLAVAAHAAAAVGEIALLFWMVLALGSLLLAAASFLM
jgi:hypothetical protein